MRRSSAAVVVQRDPSVSSSGSRTSWHSTRTSSSYDGTDNTSMSSEPRSGTSGSGSETIFRSPYARNNKGVIIHPPDSPNTVIWSHEAGHQDESEPRSSTAADRHYYTKSHRKSPR